MKNLLLAFLLLISACTNTNNSDTLTIAVAASAHFATQAIVEAFKESTDIHCQIVSSSSGKLAAQIIAGAPYDVFISANMNYAQIIFDKALSPNPPQVFAKTSLVLWSTKEYHAFSLETLKDPSIKHIAIANPKTAPFGVVAMDVLKKSDLYDTVKDKLVYGESISQVNQFVISQAADIGLTAQSIVFAPLMKNKGHWAPINPSFQTEVEQGIILINRNAKDNFVAAEKFLTFMASPKAQSILEAYGYLVE